MSFSRRAVLTTAAGAAIVGASSTPATGAAGDRTPAPDLRTLREAADYAVEKVRTVAPRVTDFPVGTKFEKWVYSRNGGRVGGFWPGTLWMAYWRSVPESTSGLRSPSRCTYGQPQGLSAVGGLVGHQYGAWLR